MSTQGPDIQALANKYSSSEVSKFQAIIIADNSGNSVLAEQLAGELSGAESIKFDEYLADLEKIEKYKEQLRSEHAQSQNHIENLDSKIAKGEQQRDAALNGHSKALTEAFNQSLAASSHESQAYDTSASSSNKNSKKSRGCTIF